MIISSIIISADVASHSTPKLHPDPLHHPAQEGPDFLDPFLFLADQLLELELIRGPTVKGQLREAAAHGQPSRARGPPPPDQTLLMAFVRLPNPAGQPPLGRKSRHRVVARPAPARGWEPGKERVGRVSAGGLLGASARAGKRPPSLHPQRVCAQSSLRMASLPLSQSH